jgi:precorrin-2/cobalt-factor-2 C20-methyltransferase
MLIGVGLGPGEPELLTLRAVRLLKEADAVYVPGRIAMEIVAPYRKATVLDFPMTGDEHLIARAMARNADSIGSSVQNRIVVLGILGDPNFFSTFWRLAAAVRERYPGTEIRTEPGISAITAFAAPAGLSITEGFVVTGGGTVRGELCLKVRRPRELAESLAREGYSRFVLVERMYMEGMRVYTGSSSGEGLPDECDYMSVLFAEKSPGTALQEEFR